LNYKYLKSALLVVALGHALTAVAQNTAGVQGAVVDATTGKAIPGAIILATSSARGAATKSATSAHDGTFQIPSLPAGTYSICVQPPHPTVLGGYLHSCHWGSSPATLSIATGQKSTGNIFKLQRGSVLRIHIDDSKQLLHQKNKDGSSPDLTMGVWNSTMFYSPITVINGPTMADYLMTVPLDTNLKFSINSQHLVLGDAKKNALSANADTQTFQHASNAIAPKVFGYSILSAK
jgi:hypothetical protein